MTLLRNMLSSMIKSFQTGALAHFHVKKITAIPWDCASGVGSLGSDSDFENRFTDCYRVLNVRVVVIYKGYVIVTVEEF